MKGLVIVFLLLAVPAAIQCKPAFEERQSSTDFSALIQSLVNQLTGPGGALYGKGLTTQVTNYLNNLLGPNNGSLTSLIGNPNLGGLDLSNLLQNLLNTLLKKDGLVQQILAAVGGDPNALNHVLNLLLGQYGALQELLGPNGFLGHLVSGKPVNLPLLLQNLLQTLLAPNGVIPRLLNVLLGTGGVLKGGLVGNLPLFGPNGVVTGLLKGLLGTHGSDTLRVLQQIVQAVLGDLSNNPQSLRGLVGSLVNTLLGSNGVVTNLLKGLGLIPK